MPFGFKLRTVVSVGANLDRRSSVDRASSHHNAIEVGERSTAFRITSGMQSFYLEVSTQPNVLLGSWPT